MPLKKEKKLIQTRVRIEEDLLDFIEATTKRLGTSRDEVVNDLVKKGRKVERLKDTGWRYIKHNNDPYVCFECQENKQAGKPKWEQGETGGALCPRCATFKYGLEPDVNVKLDQKKYESEKLVKDYKHVLEQDRLKKKEMNIWFENRELIVIFFEELKELKETAYKILGIRDTPKDFKLTTEGFLRIIDKKEKILDLILEQKEKEKWEKLQREKKQKKREAQMYG